MELQTSELASNPPICTCKASLSTHLSVLADIYQENINIAVWQRELPSALLQATTRILQDSPKLEAAFTLSPSTAFDALLDKFGDSEDARILAGDIAELVDMFCCLFELKRAGVRLTALQKAMCPKFHVDHIPCRLVSTYFGAATEWLPHEYLELHHPSLLQKQPLRILEPSKQDIQQLSIGDVALLKGEGWQGNEGSGLVHRSPASTATSPRLLLTLDFIND